MDAPIRLLIHGANGRMGRALQRLCREGEGGEVVAAVSRKVESRVIDGETREHRFIRADRFGDIDSAADHAILKGKQLVDQMGDGMFK